MIRKYLVFFMVLMLSSALLWHCKKSATASAIPKITYAGVEKIQYPGTDFDSLLLVRINFEDGDGDLGLNVGDTAYPFRLDDPFYNNIFVEYLEHVNGAYSHLVTNDTVNYNDRFIDIQPDSRNKNITGTFILKLIPITGSVLPDSVKFNVYVVDRALNKSNVVSTGGIPVKF